jgi:hypothetical protein
VFSAVNGGHDTIFGGEFGVGVGNQIVTGGTVNSLADLQAVANHTGTVTFANGSSLSLFGQTWERNSAHDEVDSPERCRDAATRPRVVLHLPAWPQWRVRDKLAAGMSPSPALPAP